MKYNFYHYDKYGFYLVLNREALLEPPISLHGFPESLHKGKNFSASEIFTIQDTGEEMARLAADRAFLRDLSQRARGADFDPRQVDQLVHAIEKQIQTAPITGGGDIFSTFWPFFFMLAVLTFEWFVRRRLNLF